MNGRLYTNTSNMKGLIGLLVISVLVSYATANSTKIVDGAVSLTKTSVEKVKALCHKDKKQYAVCGRDVDGGLYDTGRRIWQ